MTPDSPDDRPDDRPDRSAARDGFRSAEKRSFSKASKLFLTLAALVDPGSWGLLLRQLGFYYRCHVRAVRRLTIGPGAHVSPFAAFLNPERIEIGRNVRIGDRCYLWAGHASARIRIGDDVMFGPEVMVNCAVYRFEAGQPVWRQAMDEADIVIGNDVWIATRAMIMPGARIGDGAVIGAGAVVSGEIPPMSVAVGAPARVVRRRRLTGAAPSSAPP